MTNIDIAVKILKGEDVKEEESCLYLIRHGKTKLNSLHDGTIDKIRAWKDVPLDDTGIEQAHEIGKYLDGAGIEEIVSSDLQRAEVTAEIISKEIGAPFDFSSQDFRPWNLGRFTGQESKVVQSEIKKFVEQPDKTVPDGESFNAFLKRYLTALSDCMEKVERGGDKIAIVAHYRNLKATEAWFNAGLGDEVDSHTMLTDDLPVGSFMELVCSNGKNWGMRIMKYDNGNFVSKGSEGKGRSSILYSGTRERMRNMGKELASGGVRS